MGDMLQDGLASLTAELKANAMVDVSYERGQGSVALKAMLGRKDFVVDQSSSTTNIRVEWTDLDFLVPAADLVLSGVAVTPQQGDLIILIQGGVEQTYEVFPLAYGPSWRWSDPYQSMIRIHTKLIASS